MRWRRAGLEDDALALLAALAGLGEQGGTRGVLEDLPHAVVGLGRALEVLGRADLALDLLALKITTQSQ